MNPLHLLLYILIAILIVSVLIYGNNKLEKYFSWVLPTMILILAVLCLWEYFLLIQMANKIAITPIQVKIK